MRPIPKQLCDAQGRKDSAWALNSIHFTPGARTAWHCRSGGQTLYVTEYAAEG